MVLGNILIAESQQPLGLFLGGSGTNKNVEFLPRITEVVYPSSIAQAGFRTLCFLTNSCPIDTSSLEPRMSKGRDVNCFNLNMLNSIPGT